MNLGKKIRRMRQVRGLTSVALAKHARVTPGFISQLEYSQTVPSLQTLQRVATALDVSLTYSLLDASRPPQVVRHRERPSLPLAHQGARLWLLSPLPAQHLEVALLELPPGAVVWSTACAQEGQQCHLVVHGTVRADYGDHTYGLEEGDSIVWDGAMPHRLENIGHDEAQLVIAMAPAALWKQAGEGAPLSWCREERAVSGGSGTGRPKPCADAVAPAEQVATRCAPPSADTVAGEEARRAPQPRPHNTGVDGAPREAPRGAGRLPPPPAAAGRPRRP